MRPIDKEWMQHREKIMEEYFCDTKQFIEEWNEVTTLNEDVLA
jgi:hypothetical protein